MQKKWLILSPLAAVAAPLGTLTTVISCSQSATTAAGFEAKRLEAEGTLSFKTGQNALSQAQLDAIIKQPALALDWLNGFDTKNFNYQFNRAWSDKDGFFVRKDYLKFDISVSDKNNPSDSYQTKKAKVAYEIKTVDNEVENLSQKIDALKLEPKVTTISDVGIKALNNWINFINNKEDNNVIKDGITLLNTLFKNDPFNKLINADDQAGAKFIVNELNVSDQGELTFQLRIFRSDLDNNGLDIYSKMFKFNLNVKQDRQEQENLQLLNYFIKSKTLKFNDDVYDNKITQEQLLANTNFADLVDQFLLTNEAIGGLGYEIDGFNSDESALPTIMVTFNIKFKQQTSDQVQLSYQFQPSSKFAIK